jgi:rhamnose utilization protein RhaD (predicted bifunctional aldolase and dehydrogenase)
MIKNKIKDLVLISKTIGAKPEYAQGGGGNASVKLDSTRMAIKASGHILKDVNEDAGYCIVDYPKICHYLSKMDHDENMFSMKINSFAEKSENRPSMETGFHALLGEVVLHTHSIYANLINCAKEGADIFHKLFPTAIWIEYETPGRLLTSKIREALVSISELPNIIFLQNHGVIVSGKNTSEVLTIHEDLNNKIQSYFQLDSSMFKKDTGELDIEYIKSNILFPDQAVYILAGEEILNSLAAKETIAAYNFIHKTIAAKGLKHNFLSKNYVDILLQMESEKYRQNILKNDLH